MIVRFAVLVFSCLLLACGERQSAGEVSAPAVADSVIVQRAQWQSDLPASQVDEQILFGDLHVHTTFSPDAFITAMPLSGGKGLTPPAAACDYARYCSALDFWSINDHAEGITPRRWQQTREMIRDCNERAGDADNPDIVAFLGWEWSQVNIEASKHYGHKNVIFLDTDDQQVPMRAIAAPRDRLNKSPIGPVAQWMLALSDFENRQYYLGIDDYYDEIAETPICEKGVDTRKLPNDCLEVADTPSELFGKLNEWGFDSLVIPHGNSWGMNTPPGSSFDKQLSLLNHDSNLQTLFEVYSGHGSAEEYRPWRAVEKNQTGNSYCPEPSDGYLPCCWQAGNIIQQRCDAEGLLEDECQQRATVARQNFIDAGVSGHLTVSGQQVTDWLNCGQCDDCFAEPLDHRPMTSVQYALAITNFDSPGKPLRFRFGLMGSSDNHGAAPGTGYKEVSRQLNTDGMSPRNERMTNNMRDTREALAYSLALDEQTEQGLSKARNMERQSSFWMTGGLIAAHSAGRDRQAIWDAMRAKNVYGTSGDRLLLWFNETGEPEGQPAHAMGSEISLARNPQFTVSAAGAFEQLVGCPDYAVDALGLDTLKSLCGGECYNPSATRKAINKIEVVRIRPQISPNEDVGSLIDDPWRSFDCPADTQTCTVSFEDEEFVKSGREAVYYVRALQAPSDAVNGGGLRCEYDANGQCIAVSPCYAGPRTAADDDCLAPVQERAWSSPIFVSP